MQAGRPDAKPRKSRKENSRGSPSHGYKRQLDHIFPLLYEALYRIAADLLYRERSDHLFQTSDLVHEAYLRLVYQDHIQWEHHAQLLALARQIMNRILIDYARTAQFVKHGGGMTSVALDETLIPPDAERAELTNLNDCLDSLATVDVDQARVVTMRYFAGMSGEEIADVLGVSTATVTRRCRRAQAWIYHQFNQKESHRSKVGE